MSQKLANQVRNKVRGFLMKRGTTRIKRSMWNAEFASGRWDNLSDTHGDCVYPHLEKHLHGGSLLDLGCGTGNTGAELAAGAYAHYTGVDISDVALAVAKKRAEEQGRADKNEYFQAEISGYEPARRFDVILFRETIYYVAGPPLRSILARYAQWLNPGGVFLVRLWTGTGKYAGIVEFLEANYDMVEKNVAPTGTVILAFR